MFINPGRNKASSISTSTFIEKHWTKKTYTSRKNIQRSKEEEGQETKPRWLLFFCDQRKNIIGEDSEATFELEIVTLEKNNIAA